MKSTWKIKKRPNKGTICRYKKLSYRPSLPPPPPPPYYSGFKSVIVYMSMMIQYALAGPCYFLWVKQFKAHIMVQFLSFICAISWRALTGNVTPLPFTTILHFGGYKSSWTQLVSARQNLEEKNIIKLRIILETKYSRMDRAQFVNWWMERYHQEDTVSPILAWNGR